MHRLSPPGRPSSLQRQWIQGWSLHNYYNDPAKRALLKPEAIYEVVGGMKLSGFDVTAASVAPTHWSNAVAHPFEHFDFLAMPTAQLFAFDINEHWLRDSPARPCAPITNG